MRKIEIRATVSKAVFLATIAMVSCFQLHGQTAVQIRILFLNGNTGRPLKNIPVVVYNSHSDLAQQKHLRTDANGTVQTMAESGSTVRAFVDKGFIRSCEDGRFTATRWFNVEQILNVGIVETSHCKAPGPSAEPGLLVRIVRRSTFMEALGEN